VRTEEAVALGFLSDGLFDHCLLRFTTVREERHVDNWVETVVRVV
jgi:hypothetical protein